MRKMDEMELRVNQKGIKWSWAFTVFSLFIWAGYSFIKGQEVSMPFFLLILQFLVYFLITSIEKMRVDDNGGKKQLLISFVIILFLVVFGGILYFTIGH